MDQHHERPVVTAELHVTDVMGAGTPRDHHIGLGSLAGEDRVVLDE